MSNYFIFRGKKKEIVKNSYGQDILSIINQKIKSITEISESLNENQRKNLFSLRLSENTIEDLNGIQFFPNLERLTLSENRIRNINYKLPSNLKILNLSANIINKIENLDNLINLKELNLAYNNIKKIENLNTLSNVSSLDLSFNEIKKIENLDSLIKLEKLYLSSNKKIKKIEGLDRCKNLKSLVLEKLLLEKIEGLSKLKKLEILHIILFDNPGKLRNIEGLEYLVNLKEINIDIFNFFRRDMTYELYVNIYRFPCLIKNPDFESIDDWKIVLQKFPKNFAKFKKSNSKEKVEWYIEQCSKNIFKVIDKILNKSEYIEIKKNQEEESTEILNYAKEVLSPNFPNRTLDEILKREKKN